VPQPDFTPSERALIQRIEDPQSTSLAFELAYLVPSALLVAIGFAYDAKAAYAAAFAVVAAFRIYDMRSQRSVLPQLRSVLHKFREACGRD
jgi:hypothetical protein